MFDPGNENVTGEIKKKLSLWMESRQKSYNQKQNDWIKYLKENKRIMS